MSYGSLYKMQFYDRYNRKHEVYFKERDYSGNTETVTSIGFTPAYYEVNSPSDDPYEAVIRGTTARFFLKDPTGLKYLALLQADARKYRVEWYIDSAVFWRGWVAQDAFQNPYSVAPYGVEIVCTDGLATLRNYDFNIHNHQSLSTIISNALAQIHTADEYLGTSIFVYENINKYEANHSSGNGDSPLSQTYIECDDVFYDDGKPMNYYDALNHVLFPFGIIRQSGGHWHIEQINIINKPYLRRKNYLSMDYVSNEIHDPTIQTNNSTNRMIVGGTITALPPMKKFTIKQDYGKRKEILKDEDLEDWKFPNYDYNGLTYWHASLMAYKRQDKGILISGDLSAFDSSKIFYQSIQLIEVQGAVFDDGYKQYIRLTINYKVESNNPCQWAWALWQDFAGSRYTYDRGSNTWFAAPPYYINFVNETGNNTGELVLDIKYSTYPGTLQLVIYDVWGSGVNQLYLNKLSLEFFEKDFTYDDDIDHEIEINANHNNTKDYDMNIGEAPLRNVNDPDTKIPNATLIYKNLFLYKDGSDYIPTSKWDYRDANNPQSLVNLLSSEIATFRQQTRMIVSSRFMTKNLENNSCVIDQYNGDRRFMVLQGTYDAKYAQWDSVELLELLPYYKILSTQDHKVIYTQDGKKIIIP